MYSLELTCPVGRAEELTLRLWEYGTLAVSESEDNGVSTVLAGFGTDVDRETLLNEFAAYAPLWRRDDTDWEMVSRDAWKPKAVGDRLFLAPFWSDEPTPQGRLRVIHNPGQASGTGEHPCTQLALHALEEVIAPGCHLLDVGTGSGILAIAGMRLGARASVGIDVDEQALSSARENFALNGLEPQIVAGSADCVRDIWADITVANISATVLFSIMDEVLRVTRGGGYLILTGFPHAEAGAVRNLFPSSEITTSGEWSCVLAKLS